MPRLYVVKQYYPNSTYHVFNRACQNNVLFRDEKDFWFYRRKMKDLLEEYTGQAHLISYALMRTHYHFEIFQQDEQVITEIMKRMSGTYSWHLRKKYNHIGPVYESNMKARLLKNKKDIDDVKRYILNNPIDEGYLQWKHVGTSL